MEVNGHNVVEETHKQVVQRIKAVANETKLLVIDPQGQLYYAERNIIITSSMPNVQKMRTPATQPQRINNRPDNLKLAVTTATAITESGQTNGSSMAPPITKSSLKVFCYLHFLSFARKLFSILSTKLIIALSHFADSFLK